MFRVLSVLFYSQLFYKSKLSFGFSNILSFVVDVTHKDLAIFWKEFLSWRALSKVVVVLSLRGQVTQIRVTQSSSHFATSQV